MTENQDKNPDKQYEQASSEAAEPQAASSKTPAKFGGITNHIHINKYLSRLRNPAVVLGLVGYLLTIGASFGLKLDNEAVFNVVQALSSIFVLLGIMNNPDEGGCDVPKINNNTKK